MLGVSWILLLLITDYAEIIFRNKSLVPLFTCMLNSRYIHVNVVVWNNTYLQSFKLLMLKKIKNGPPYCRSTTAVLSIRWTPGYNSRRSHLFENVRNTRTKRSCCLCILRLYHFLIKYLLYSLFNALLGNSFSPGITPHEVQWKLIEFVRPMIIHDSS